LTHDSNDSAWDCHLSADRGLKRVLGAPSADQDRRSSETQAGFAIASAAKQPAKVAPVGVDHRTRRLHTLLLGRQRIPLERSGVPVKRVPNRPASVLRPFVLDEWQAVIGAKTMPRPMPIQAQ